MDPQQEEILAGVAEEARTLFPECYAGKTDREIIKDLGETIRRALKSGLLSEDDL